MRFWLKMAGKASARPSCSASRQATVELLKGVAMALGREADGSEDEAVVERLPYLIADVLDTIDVLKGL